MMIQFAQRMEHLRPSEIREMLKVTEDEAIISLAGGNPAPELFPVSAMAATTQAVLEEAGGQALQYSTTEGFAPLRAQIAKRMNRKFKTAFAARNILITNGSQQGLDLSGKVFLNEGDAVLCEKPMYLAAINAFRVFRPRFVEVPTDSEGMITAELERLLATTDRLKLVYVVPDFQNPTGISWSAERRRQFMDAVSRYDIAVIEDNPYGELRYEGELLPSLKSMDRKGQVICFGTFSKTFCPGLRVGWVAAEEPILEKYILVKQSADLHTSSLSQRTISKFLDSYDFDANVEIIKATYKKRRDIMLRCMAKEFPAEIRYTQPHGGLFIWVELPSCLNARDILTVCLEHQVAFVPGGAFFPNGGMENTMRLNFSNMTEERIAEGIRRLGKVLRQMLNPAAH
jgi:DNA-binding transcriptional MocR family regulator